MEKIVLTAPQMRFARQLLVDCVPPCATLDNHTLVIFEGKLREAFDRLSDVLQECRLDFAEGTPEVFSEYWAIRRLRERLLRALQAREAPGPAPAVETGPAPLAAVGR